MTGVVVDKMVIAAVLDRAVGTMREKMAADIGDGPVVVCECMLKRGRQCMIHNNPCLTRA